MDDNDQSVQSLIVRYLIAHTQCSGCGHRYEPEDVQVRNHRGHIWVASVTCSHCGLRGLIMATIKTKDVQETDEVAESDGEELASFEQMGPISSDEVLDFHRLLEEFDGNLVQFLEKCSRV